MKKRNAVKKYPKKNKKKKLEKDINLSSDSDSESQTEKEKNLNKKVVSPRKNRKKDIIEKGEIPLFIGNKIKRENIKEEKTDEENMYSPIKKEKGVKQEKSEEDNMVVFPYEFTERLIDALSCTYCKGIYIRPYVININGCNHIFCLGCITKMLEDTESGTCPTCKCHFTERNIKYSDVTDFYIGKFFPEIPKIIEKNKERLNKFMEQEAMKYNQNKSPSEKGIQLKCEIKPFTESVSSENRLGEPILGNKFFIKIVTCKEDVVEIIKGEVIKRLNLKGKLKTEDLELRMQGIEVSQFKTFENLRSLPTNLSENIIFYYSKRSDY